MPCGDGKAAAREVGNIAARQQGVVHPGGGRTRKTVVHRQATDGGGAIEGNGIEALGRAFNRVGAWGDTNGISHEKTSLGEG